MYNHLFATNEVTGLIRSFEQDRRSIAYQPIPVTRCDDSGNVVQTAITPVEQYKFVTDARGFHATWKHCGHGDKNDRLVQRARNDLGFKQFLSADPRAKLAMDALGLTKDSIGGGDLAGIYLPYELATISGRVLKQPLPPLTSREHFPVNSESSNGAKQFIRRRTVKHGTAQWAGTAAQSPNPNASLSRGELVSKIQYAQATFACSIFDLNSAEFANFQMQDTGIEGAIRAIEELDNFVVWSGDTTVNLFGVLNCPLLPTYISSLTFSASADSQVMAQYLAGIINGVITQSFTAFRPTNVVMSPSLYGFLAGQNIPIGTTGIAQTIIEWLETNTMLGAQLKGKITFAQELEGAGPSGAQVFYVYARNEDAGQIVTTGGVQALPVQFIGTQVNQIFYKGIGGFVSANPASNGLAYITLA